MAKNAKTPAMVLQELSIKKGYPPPTYEIIHSIMGTHENRFDYRVTIAGIQAEGTGSSKQVSKHNAAYSALKVLEDMGIYNPLENPVQEFNASLQITTPDSPFKTSVNCIGPLKDLCLEYKIPDPVFTIISDVGPPHSREFTFECSVASIKTIATGYTKKMAKQLAAKDMLDRIKDILPDIAEQYAVKEDLLAISDVNNKALRVYNKFFGTIVPDKTVLIDDHSCTLKKIMQNSGIKFEDFSEEFSQKTEESLKLILEKLGLSYNFYHIQDNPTMISLSLSTDTPFTTLGIGKTLEEAKNNALDNAFEIMEVFMES